MSDAAALSFANVTTRYGALVANQDVTLDVAPGTIHALVGENGAGKSTLLRVAYGEVRADAGSVRVHGRELPLQAHGPAAAIAAGIGMVHQHFMLVPPLTVLENVVLGREPTDERGMLALDRARAELERISEVPLPRLSARIEDLSVGEQQRVEIVKVLWRGADVLLLDEPTAVLTPAEVRELFAVLRALAARGKTIVLVTHKLDEVAAIADAVTVMRRGAIVARFGPTPGARLPIAEVARAMVGRELPPAMTVLPGAAGKAVLSCRGLYVGRAVDGVDLTVGAGEIVGVAGVEGNGQRELVLALAGLTRAEGSIELAGTLGHIPDDRHARGVILDFTVAENLLLGRQREFTRAGGVIDRARLHAEARALCERFDVRPPDPTALVGSLSGGNQQKLVVAREITRPGLRALIAAQPTRGVDLGATAAIHRELVGARERGVGILLVSSDLAELRALADVIVVMYRGRIAGTIDRAAASEDRLGALMTGAA